jgi:transposase
MKKQFLRLGCGLDISKAKFDACFCGQTAAGQVVVRARRKFDNTPAKIQQFIQWLAQQRAKLDADRQLPFQVVTETTGVYHEAVLHAAYEAGLPICLEQASRVKTYLRSIGQHSKTDKLDAQGIGRLACERTLRRWQPCSPKIMEIRAAMRHRRSLIVSRTRLSNQLHATQYAHWSSKAVNQSIRRLLKRMEHEVTQIEQQLTQLYQADDILRTKIDPIIDSLPGVGLWTVLNTVAETNGFEQIHSAKQLASYAGYDILQNQSGQHTGRSRISKRGNVRLRGPLYMAAMSVIRTKTGPLYELYARISLRNPHAYKIGNTAVQRKLLLLIYALYQKGERYDPEYQQKPNLGLRIQEVRQNDSSGETPELYEIELQKETLPL